MQIIIRGVLANLDRSLSCHSPLNLRTPRPHLGRDSHDPPPGARSLLFIERLFQTSAAHRICTTTHTPPPQPSWAGDGRCGFVRNCVSCGRDRVVGEGGIVVMHRLLESHATWGVRCRDRYSLETDVSDCLRSGGRIRTPVLRLLFGRVRCRFEKSAA